MLLATAPVARPALASLLRWQEPLATRLRFRYALPGMVANRLLNVELVREFRSSFLRVLFRPFLEQSDVSMSKCRPINFAAAMFLCWPF